MLLDKLSRHQGIGKGVIQRVEIAHSRPQAKDAFALEVGLCAQEGVCMSSTPLDCTSTMLPVTCWVCLSGLRALPCPFDLPIRGVAHANCHHLCAPPDASLLTATVHTVYICIYNSNLSSEMSIGSVAPLCGCLVECSPVMTDPLPGLPVLSVCAQTASKSSI